MFEGLNPLPADPILGLIQLYQQDTNLEKVDLGVGVYRDEAGDTPVLQAVKQAEQKLWQQQDSKAYLGAVGNHQFNELYARMLLGEHSAALADQRVAMVQTPGGCGALRVGAELIMAARAKTRIWVSDPTWGNHVPLLGNAGLVIETYPYYDPEHNGLNFQAMVDTLARVPAGDMVLLHASCHNPTGVDLNLEQWRAIAELAAERGFVPFVDIAYQGFDQGVEADAAGLRLLCERLPEVLIAASCSKNFGLYRERVGAVALVAQSVASARAASSHMASIVRGIYSMPPDHGAALVAMVLGDAALREQWQAELATMRDRLNGLRSEFSAAMAQRLGHGRFDFVQMQHGMFSFLGLSPGQVAMLARDYAIYMLGSSRISIAGLNRRNLGYVCDAIAQVSGINV